MRAHAALALVALALASCGDREKPVSSRDSSAIPTAVATAPAPSGSFAALMAQEFSALQEGITLGAWRVAHTLDYLAQPKPDDEEVSWCAQSVSAATLASGGLAIRRAYFYAPIPDSTSFGAPVAAPMVERDCALGAITISTMSPVGRDSILGQATAELHRAYPGAPTEGVGTVGWGLPDGVQWKSGVVGFVLGRPLRHSGGDDDSYVPADTVKVVAVLPIADASMRLAWSGPDYSAGVEDSVIGPLIDTDAACTVRLDSVVAAGEKHLLVLKDTTLLVTLHFMIADALSDQLSHEGQASDSAIRAEAISHYRAALRADRLHRYPATTRARWVLWRLEAGLLPATIAWFRDCGD